MNPLHRRDVIRALDTNLTTLEQIVAALPDDGTTRPQEGRWSPCEVLEHLVSVELGVHFVIRKAMGSPATALRTREKDALILGLAAIPTKVTAPDRLVPNGKFTSAVDALAALREARAQTIVLARTLPEPWDTNHFPHPFFGPLDLGQWLLMAATHGDRHAAQIIAA